MKKKLYKDRKNQMFMGVCAGMAEYFNMDPTMMRMIWILVAFFTRGALTLLIYLICALAIPDKPDYL